MLNSQPLHLCRRRSILSSSFFSRLGISLCVSFTRLAALKTSVHTPQPVFTGPDTLANSGNSFAKQGPTGDFRHRIPILRTCTTTELVPYQRGRWQVGRKDTFTSRAHPVQPVWVENKRLGRHDCGWGWNRRSRCVGHDLSCCTRRSCFCCLPSWRQFHGPKCFRSSTR